jgi:hypothetical protein
VQVEQEVVRMDRLHADRFACVPVERCVPSRSTLVSASASSDGR